MTPKGKTMSVSETIALQSIETHVKKQSKISKIVKSNFTPPLQEVYYNPDLDKIEFSLDFQTGFEIGPNYELIYEGCTDDINKAFGLKDLDTIPYEINQLTDSMKTSIKETLKSKLNSMSKYVDCQIKNTDEVKLAADEIREMLNAIADTRCFYITDEAGVTRGVQPPSSFKVQAGMIPVPWKFMYVDFKAQRWTDIAHIVDKILDYDSFKNLGSSGRFDPEGRRVDINDGRHSAMLLALTGCPYCLVSGPVSNKRSINMIVFTVKNSLAKPVTAYDELHTVKGKAELERDEGGVHSIDTRIYTLSASKFRTSDKQVYEMFQLLAKFGIELAPPEKGKQNRRTLESGEWYRVDKLIEFVQNENYCQWTPKKSPAEIEDTFLFDALHIMKDEVIDNGGYAAHELIWAILELFAVTQKMSGIGDKKRMNMRTAIKTALNEWLPKIPATGAVRKKMDRSYYFYEQWGTASKRIPATHLLWTLEPTKKKYIDSFLATGLWSIINECSKLTKVEKAMFDCPELTWNVAQQDGSIKELTGQLLDDRNLPFSFDHSFKNTSTKKLKAVTVVGDDEDESDDE
jgi:hypothetical protein